MHQPEKNISETGKKLMMIKRRKFLLRISGMIGWGSLWVWLTGSAVAMLRYFFPRVRYEPPTRFKIGRLEDYMPDTIDSRWLKKHHIFVVRDTERLYVLQAACPHLGCAVSWYNVESYFKCPCHGSFFDLEGDVIGGPAPEPLTRVALSVDPTGTIVVDVVQKEHRPGLREKGIFSLEA